MTDDFGVPFFVASTVQGLGRYGNTVTVRDARTGAVTDAVTNAVTAAVPDRRLDCTGVHPAGPPGTYLLTGGDPYRLRVDGEGRIAELAPFPADGPIDWISPDGRLAAGRHRDGPIPGPPGSAFDPRRRLSTALRELSTGRTVSHLPGAAGQLSHLTWAADSRRVAFEWVSYEGTFPMAGAHEIRVADAHARDWVGNGRTVVADTSGEHGELHGPVISADGESVYVTAAQPEPTGGEPWTRLLEFPVSGGPPRVLFELRYSATSHNVIFMWGTVCRNTVGTHLLIFPSGWAYRLSLATGEVIRLPYPEGSCTAAAW
ncbi:hypothetical protein ACQEU3_09125 [Spirillospora sp. CA-253888]